MLGFTTLEAAKQAWRVNLFGCQDNNGGGDNNIFLLIYVRREGSKTERQKDKHEKGFLITSCVGSFPAWMACR